METIYFQPKGIRPQYCEAGIIHESDPEHIWYLTEPGKILISDVKIIPKENVTYDKKSRSYIVKQSCVKTKNKNIMTKEEARKMLIGATRELRQANIVLEAHRQGVEDIQEEIAKLEAIINKPDRWQDRLVQPDKEPYFYLLSNIDKGLIVDLSSNNDRSPEHAFKTEKQAELIKEKTLLMWEMHNFASVKNGDWMPNWDNRDQAKFGIISRGNEIEVDWYSSYNSFVFGIAVKSREIAGEMIGIFGNRIEKFYNKQY